MNKIDNVYGIEMYYEIVPDRVNILDSNGKYYDYVNYIDIEDVEEWILFKLERITIQALCYSMEFNHKLYNSLDELTYDLQDPEITEDNDYVNIFKVNDKKYYIWSE